MKNKRKRTNENLSYKTEKCKIFCLPVIIKKGTNYPFEEVCKIWGQGNKNTWSYTLLHHQIKERKILEPHLGYEKPADYLLRNMVAQLESYLWDT